MLQDNETILRIEDVSSKNFANRFVHSEEVVQQPSFFKTARWLRFEVENQSHQEAWLLEFAFPLIYDIKIYSEEESEKPSVRQCS